MLYRLQNQYTSWYNKKIIKQKMTDKPRQNNFCDTFFLDGENFRINNKLDYKSYPEFLEYFKQLKSVSLHNLIVGINFTYGWMPTILNFRSDKFDEALVILNKAKKEEGKISSEELILLKKLFNNSLVGTSKLLHFINPNKFSILDSRVYRYWTGMEPYDYRLERIETYWDYLNLCEDLVKHDKFSAVKIRVESQVGYQMTPFRIVELVMYLKGKKQREVKKENRMR